MNVALSRRDFANPPRSIVRAILRADDEEIGRT